MDVDTQAADHPAQQRTAGLVELDRHQPGRHLDDMRRHPERAQCVGRFQAQQTAPDDDGVAGAAHRERRAHIGADRIEVVQRAVDVTTGQVVARHGRHERGGTGGQHQRVIAEPFTADAVTTALASRSTVATGLSRISPDAVVVAVAVTWERETVAVPVLGVGGQRNAVIGGVGLLGQDGDPPGRGGVAGPQRLDEAVPDHAVSDDDHVFYCLHRPRL